MVGKFTAYGSMVYTHTPLHLASRNGHKNVVEQLIKVHAPLPQGTGYKNAVEQIIELEIHNPLPQGTGYKTLHEGCGTTYKGTRPPASRNRVQERCGTTYKCTQYKPPCLQKQGKKKLYLNILSCWLFLEKCSDQQIVTL